MSAQTGKDIRTKIAEGAYDIERQFDRSANKRERRKERREKFQHDLEVENRIPDSPAFAGLFNLAWEERVSEGLLAVVEYYEALIEQIVDPVMVYATAQTLKKESS